MEECAKRPRMGDSDGEDGKVTKGTWSKGEDDRLLDAVNRHGIDNWKEVSLEVVGRSAKQCRDRYKLKLDPNINHGPWTKIEDERLLELSQEHGRAWTKIAKFMPGRTENAVKSRISSLERSRVRDWTPEEDLLLKQLQQDNVDFEDMVDKFPNRSIHSIRKRSQHLHMDEVAAKLRQNMASSTKSDMYGIDAKQEQTGGINLPKTASFAPGTFAAVPQQKATAPSVHRQVDTSRLQRQSTSMTVLLQVLGGDGSNLTSASQPQATSHSFSPYRSQQQQQPSNLLSRESSSFPWSPLNNISSSSMGLSDLPGTDTETPKQRLLQALGMSEKTD